MQNDHDQGDLSHLTGNLVGQSLDHFDPIQGLIDNEEKAEELRNMRYGFRAGAHNILIDSRTLCEVVQSAQIYHLPNTHPWVLGVINLRGNLVPVFDIMRRLDETATQSEDQQLLVLEQGEQAVGIYIDGLPRALKIDPEDSELHVNIPPDLPEAIRKHVTTAFRVDGNTWLEINHRDLFADLLTDSGVHSDTLV